MNNILYVKAGLTTTVWICNTISVVHNRQMQREALEKSIKYEDNTTGFLPAVIVTMILW
jgi:hypothetical protein